MSPKRTAFYKIIKSIKSCKTLNQIDGCLNMIENYFSLYFNTNKVSFAQACKIIMNRRIERRMFKEEIHNHIESLKLTK